MMITCIENARVLTPFTFLDAAVVVRDGVIVEVAQHVTLPETARVIDARGMYLTPGFIDLHVHGGGGHSAMGAGPEEIVAMANAHAAFGTTAILPTTLAAPLPQLLRAVENVRAAQSRPCDAQILGVHLEGPCLSRAQSGAQAPESLCIPAQCDLTPLLDAWPEGVRIMGVAPELPGALALGDALCARGVLPSIAHSNATYAQVEAAMAHGFADVTHLYSGCSTIVRENGYRVPGVVEAGLNLDGLTVQVIADGRHLPPPLLQLIYRCKGAERILLVTDGLDYAGAELSEGTVYRQANGVETLYEDGVMKMLDRQAFAGSVATMQRLVQTMYAAGIPLLDAVRMATDTPARRIGLRKGRVEAGYDADLLLLDDALQVTGCMVRGRVLRGA